MPTTRLEAFSDGVLAIIITIMILELKVPAGADVAVLRAILPAFVAYVVSFVFLAIYWNNHHHMLQVTKNVDGRVLWANMHLLFWLSLVPAITAWIGRNPTAPWPAAIYGVVFFLAAVAYFILQTTIIRLDGSGSVLARAIGKDVKGKLSPVLYLAAIPLAFVHPFISDTIYVVVALLWLIPDKRIENEMNT